MLSYCAKLWYAWTSAKRVQLAAKSDAPMKISRISNAAYAISCDHRIKFVSRPLHSVDDPDQPDENCVRRANQELLVAIVEEARRQVREDS